MAWQDKFSRDEFHQEVRRLHYEQGLSASRVAAVIGLGCSKNMVIRALQTIQGKTRSTVKFPDSVWPSEPKTKEPCSAEPPEIPVSLLKVREGQCRAPLWPDFLHSRERVPTSEHMLCGLPTKENSHYCPEHHDVFYPAELQKRVMKPKKQEPTDNARYFG